VVGWWLATWMVALLATAVVWPVRMVRGRWLVIAYLVDSPEDKQLARVWVRGRKLADATAAQWAAEIKLHGRPPLSTAPTKTDPSLPTP